PAVLEFAAGSLDINGETINFGAASSAGQRVNDLANAINSNAALKEAGVFAYIQSGALRLESRNADLVIANSDVAETGLVDATIPYVPGVGMTGFENLDVLNSTNADNAILAMDSALAAVNSARASLGAVQSRFESTIENLNIANENLTASKSRIMDADFAAETAALSSAQVLQQAGTAMVAQANQVPQGVLQLLQG
ncbi:MAG: flagellin, partial [Comamonas sp.]